MHAEELNLSRYPATF